MPRDAAERGGKPAPSAHAMIRSIAVLCSVTVAVGAIPATGQTPGSTAVTVQGFLQQDVQSGAWSILLPLPLKLLGVRTFVLPAAGDSARWESFRNRYVEAKGSVSASPAGAQPATLRIAVEHLKEVDPPGQGRQAVNRGPVWWALVTLDVIPNRFVWRDSGGVATGVAPVLRYSLINRHDGPIVFDLPTDELLCFTVQPAEGPGRWSDTTRLANPGHRHFVVARADMYRDGVPLPRDAAPAPGKYLARAGLCRIGDYDVSAKFEVQ